MAPKIEAYLDTGAFIAFLDRSDSYHLLFKKLFSDPCKLVCSSLVIVEAHGWFLRRYDRRRANEFLLFIESFPVLKTISFGSKELLASQQVIQKFSDQNLTLADAHGLQIIKERKLKQCWSTDRHLSLSGAGLVIN